MYMHGYMCMHIFRQLTYDKARDTATHTLRGDDITKKVNNLINKHNKTMTNGHVCVCVCVTVQLHACVWVCNVSNRIVSSSPFHFSGLHATIDYRQ